MNVQFNQNAYFINKAHSITASTPCHQVLATGWQRATLLPVNTVHCFPYKAKYIWDDEGCVLLFTTSCGERNFLLNANK
jgi:hypothetical protein